MIERKDDNTDIRFTINDYHKKDAFASFLPGIAGPDGTPTWCFYVNRGQCVSSFGHSDKNHPILEFLPADQAYRDTRILGFRTFVRDEDGRIREPFCGSERDCPVERRMSIGCADFVLTENDGALEYRVTYSTLSAEVYPGLLRFVEIRNISGRKQSLSIIDGLPRIVPNGIGDAALKSMSNTAAAWIETQVSDPQVPLFSIRASMDDTVEVKAVPDFHFMAALAVMEEGEQVLEPIVDPSLVFGSDWSFNFPEALKNLENSNYPEKEAVLFGQYPCAFASVPVSLDTDQSVRLYSIYGYADSLEVINAAKPLWQQSQWYTQKYEEYRRYVDECVAPFRMMSAHPALDAYTLQTSLDNTLRGGMPVVFENGGSTRIFHLYSRKHGDLERDYNDFALPSSRFSAGFGNYRDMNQNRRIDVAVNPFVGDSNIRLFMNLIQADGYNPLIVRPGAFQLSEEIDESILDQYPFLRQFMGKTATPGQLLDSGLSMDGLNSVLQFSEYQTSADFGEGYWVDHWTYNLDLIDQYLRIYPEKTHELFFGVRNYQWYHSRIRIRPLQERFVLEDAEVTPREHLVDSDYSWCFLENTSNLFEKLAVLAIVKYASLGPAETGLEMEAGRPGWYDALNGLPGHFGSSISDAVELLRLLRMLITILTQNSHEKITLFAAAWVLCREIVDVDQLADSHERWLGRWYARDAYREKLYLGQFEENIIENPLFSTILQDWETRLSAHIDHAVKDNKGILPTFYRFEVEEWTDLGNGYAIPAKMHRQTLPLFLEGAVKQMKLLDNPESKLQVHHKILQSDLYDEKLKMFVVNAALDNEPGTIGRAKAFPDGWLENGSVWMHMEYKYLLELLRSGNGETFWTVARQALVPFLNPERYRRSIYENSSFIASSRYAVPSQHGRGFVGRLSGATAEYLTMWSEFLLGANPFIVIDKALCFAPQPVLPADLFREDGTIVFKLFNSTEVIYENPEGLNLFNSNDYIISRIVLSQNGSSSVFQNHLPEKQARSLRAGKVDSLRVEFRSA